MVIVKGKGFKVKGVLRSRDFKVKSVFAGTPVPAPLLKVKGVLRSRSWKTSYIEEETLRVSPHTFQEFLTHSVYERGAGW